MGIQRQPGDIAFKSETAPFNWRSGNNSYVSIHDAVVDRRPSYGKGTRIKLPGGTVFKKATDYSHTSYTLNVGSPYIGERPSSWRYVEDGGREASQYTKIDYAYSEFGGGFHPSLTGAFKNEVVTKALLDIANQKAGIGEDLATFKQTLSLFGGKVGLLVGALKAVKSKPAWKKYLKQSSRDLRRRPLDAAAKGYIEYIYGLKPLVDDVYGVAELLKELGIRDLLVHGHGKAHRTEETPGNGTWRHGLSYTRTMPLSRQASAKAACHLHARLDPNHSGLRSLNQLGLLNPLSLAWDLVPWSFVVDWVTPIGPVLNALTAPAGLIFIDGCTSIKTEESAQHRFQVFSTYFNPDWPTAVTYSDGQFSVEGEGYVRTRLGSWPFPGFYFRSDPFGADRPLKALALGILALKKYRLTV